MHQPSDPVVPTTTHEGAHPTWDLGATYYGRTTHDNVYDTAMHQPSDPVVPTTTHEGTHPTWDLGATYYGTTTHDNVYDTAMHQPTDPVVPTTTHEGAHDTFDYGATTQVYGTAMYQPTDPFATHDNVLPATTTHASTTTAQWIFTTQPQWTSYAWANSEPHYTSSGTGNVNNDHTHDSNSMGLSFDTRSICPSPNRLSSSCLLRNSHFSSGAVKNLRSLFLILKVPTCLLIVWLVSVCLILSIFSVFHRVFVGCRYNGSVLAASSERHFQHCRSVCVSFRCSAQRHAKQQRIEIGDGQSGQTLKQ
jgi:hypothetical protein